MEWRVEKLWVEGKSESIEKARENGQLGNFHSVPKAAGGPSVYHEQLSQRRLFGQQGETGRQAGPLPSLAYLADWPATRRCRPTSPAARKMSLFTAREKQSIYDNLRLWVRARRSALSGVPRGSFRLPPLFEAFFPLPLFQLIYSTSPTARRLAARMEGGALLYLTRFFNAACRSPVFSCRHLVAPFCGSVNGRVN